MNDQDRIVALQLARSAIERYLQDRSILPAPTHVPFCEYSGAFVSLKIDRELRGCIGYAEPKFPLGRAIVQGAILAATDDPRFNPVTPVELPLVRIEISVLSSFRTANPLEVEPGIHGICIEASGARGLLLPQVPVEHGWDRETFLIYGCRKAGLPDYAWQQDSTTLLVFTAEVFAEQHLSSN